MAKDISTDTTGLENIIATGADLLVTYGLSLLGAIAILIIGRMASKFLSNLAYKGMKKAKMDETLSLFLSSMARYAVMAFTLVAVLAQFGIQTASLIAVLGAAGLAVGLALQGTLSHVASGVMILILRPFKIGDVVSTDGGVSGTVRAIGLFVTELDTPQNVRIIVPNGKMYDAILSNFNAHNTRRADIEVGIDYSDDIDKAIEIMAKAIRSDDRLKEPKGRDLKIVVSSLGDSSVNLTARAWVSADDYWLFKVDMNKTIKQAFDKGGISIPFPQRVVHMEK